MVFNETTLITELDGDLAKLAGLHKHLCPRQVLGVRMARYAAELLRLDLPQTNKRLFTFVETDGCLVDGIVVVTGCTLGHRTMRLVDYGKVAATFVDTQTDRAVRIWPDPASRTRAAQYVPDVRSRWHAQLAAYQRMATTDLLRASWVQLRVSLKTIISRPGVRVTCAGCGEEIINEREVLRAGQPFCCGCADGSYWKALGPASERDAFSGVVLRQEG